MKRMRILFAMAPLLVMLLGLTGATALAQTPTATSLAVASDPTLGAILTGANGMTVYLFTPDTTAGASNCIDDCATNWPPVPADDMMSLPEGVPGTLGSIDRSDGIKQLTYNDIPLYYFIQDKNPGDVVGQGKGGVWFVVAPGMSLTTYPAPPGEGTPVPAAAFATGFTSELGPFLIDSKGMTVYLFTKDTEMGSSACYDDCATNWPPVPGDASLTLPPGMPGTLGAITRTDGTNQATYNDIPLYYFAGDAAAGDTNGQEVGDVWYVVTPGMQFGDEPHESDE